LVVSSNSGSARTGTVTVADHPQVISQESLACNASLTTGADPFGAGGGGGAVQVVIAEGCRWTATSAASWIGITAGADGTGPGSVQFTVAPNPTTSPRQGVMTIAGRAITVTQLAASDPAPPAPTPPPAPPPTPSPPPPAPPACTYALSATSQAVAAAGGTGAVGVRAGTDCSWTARSNVDWITVTAGGAGAGDSQVTYAVAANTATTARTGTLTIAGSIFTVTQAAAPCTYTIAPVSMTVAAAGGTGAVAVTTSAGCSWTAAADVGWLTISGTASGSGNGTVNVAASANTAVTQRVGTLTIAGKTFTVTQAAAACVYAISPVSQSVAAAGGTGSVAITTVAGCTWTAAADVGWLTISGTASGSGNGTVNFAASANTATTSRTGTLTIAGKTFTVTQAGAAPACTYSLMPTSHSVGAGGGNDDVKVDTTAGCAWTAVANVAWITLTGATSGSGDGTVKYSVSANTASNARTGTLTIAGKTFTVNQAGR
jgi:hypothetical protein